MMETQIHVLPQSHCRFHVNEAGVFAELPVRVVGDPSLPVIGINHFPGRTKTKVEVVNLKAMGRNTLFPTYTQQTLY